MNPDLPSPEPIFFPMTLWRPPKDEEFEMMVRRPEGTQMGRRGDFA